jgi:hypothetical protein
MGHVLTAVFRSGPIPKPDEARLQRIKGGTTKVTSRRVFAFLWRVNAVLILLTAVLACVVLLFVTWQIYRETTRTRHVSAVVNVAEDQLDRSKLQLGSFEQIDGSSVLRAPLRVEQQYAFGSGSKETSSVQNYLFYDPSSRSSHWLLPGNKGLFLATHELPERRASKPERRVVAVVYELVEADTTGDKRLTASDAKVVAVSNANGLRFTRVLVGVEEVNAVTLTADARILVLYTASSTLKAAEIDVATYKIIRDAPLQTVAPRRQKQL